MDIHVILVEIKGGNLLSMSLKGVNIKVRNSKL